MKVLMIDSEYFCYPNGISDFSQLQSYLNDNHNKFIKLIKLTDENTVPPFFIEEFKKETYVNLSTVMSVSEVDAELMTKADYQTSLNNAIDETCMNCENFNESTMSCACGAIRTSLCLNGECECYAYNCIL